MSALIYHHSDGYILFEAQVVETLNGFRQNPGTNESGGILLGFRRPPHLHVVDCTVPSRRDHRNPFAFFRFDRRHQDAAKKLWETTKGAGYYLGEWHTHPVASPSPSITDRKEWEKLMRSPLGPDLLFLIVGRVHWYLQRSACIVGKPDGL